MEVNSTTAAPLKLAAASAPITQQAETAKPAQALSDTVTISQEAQARLAAESDPEPTDGGVATTMNTGLEPPPPPPPVGKQDN